MNREAGKRIAALSLALFLMLGGAAWAGEGNASSDAPRAAAVQEEDRDIPLPAEAKELARPGKEPLAVPSDDARLLAALGHSRGIVPLDLERLRTQTEWFALRLQGGNYGFTAEAALFTLRWKYVVWEILRFGGGGGARGFTDRGAATAGYAGSAVGVQLPLGESGRHEIRLATGLFGGQLRLFVRNSNDEHPSEHSYSSYGPFVLIEGSYVYHIAQRVALQVGIELLIPTYKALHSRLMYSEPTLLGMPDPLLAGFVGFRF